MPTYYALPQIILERRQRNHSFFSSLVNIHGIDHLAYYVFSVIRIYIFGAKSNMNAIDIWEQHNSSVSSTCISLISPLFKQCSCPQQLKSY